MVAIILRFYIQIYSSEDDCAQTNVSIRLCFWRQNGIQKYIYFRLLFAV